MSYSETLVLPDDQVLSFEPSRGSRYDAPFGRTIYLEEIPNPLSLQKKQATILHLLRTFSRLRARAKGRNTYRNLVSQLRDLPLTYNAMIDRSEESNRLDDGPTMGKRWTIH